MEEKMNVSQWGNQWNDPINWNHLNFQVSSNGRKFIRHPSNMGTVMSMNDGKERNVLILDSQYRGKGYWGLGYYSRDHYCKKYGTIDGLEKTLPFSGWSDEALNSYYLTIANQDIHTSKENTDFMMSMNSNIQFHAGYCRSKTISHNGIEIGCDAPNLNTLIRIYAEMIQLDSMDPTVSNYSCYSLREWFSDADYRFCWSSSLNFPSVAVAIYYNSDIDYSSFDFIFGFLPVLEV